MYPRPSLACRPYGNASRSELDREQAALLEGRHRGLGLMGVWQGASEWYGGQVQQIASLIESGKSFAVRLERLEKRRSNRFARYFGSRRLLQLRIGRKLMLSRGVHVQSFLSQHEFVLCGRVYKPFFAKEDGVYLLEVNKDFERTPRVSEGDHHRVSYGEFLTWHNPIALNSNQVCQPI